MSKRQDVVLGPSLAAIRRSRQISQATLAQRASVSEGLVANLEAGHRQPSRETLVALAAVLDTPVESIGLFVDVSTEQLAALLPATVEATRALVAVAAAETSAA